MKRLYVVLGAVAVAVLIAIFFLYSSLNRVVEAAIEKVGSDLTQTTVVLDEVSISPASGRGTLRGFRVTNPQGFNDGAAFAFDNATVVVDVSTLAQDPIIIEHLIVENPEITYEIGRNRDNISVLKENVGSYDTGTEGGLSARGGERPPSFIIRDLQLVGGTVNITASGLDENLVSSSLPDIRLENIGAQGNSASPEEVATQVLAQLSSAVAGAVRNVDVDALGEAAGDQAEQIGDALREGGQRAREALENLIDRQQ